MRHLVRRLVALLSVLVVLAGVAPMTSASAAAVPTVPDYGPQTDAYATYEAETQCLCPKVTPRSSPGS